MTMEAFVFILIISTVELSIISKKMNLMNQTANDGGGLFQKFKETSVDYIESSYKDEDELLRILFKDYNPNIIPRRNSNESLKLYIGLAMIQLINMFEKEQVMKTNVWLHMWYNDFQLKWSHMDRYNHIYSIRVPFNMVWTPDIVLFNNAYGDYEVSYKTNVVLYQQGGILWIPPAIYKSTCKIEVKFFPFDVQVCEMRFGSWIYNSQEITLDYFENMMNVDLNEYVPSGTWDIIEVPAFIEYSNHSSSGTKAQMVYKIKMQRKTLFYTINLIIPTFLISCLSICVFYLPCDESGSGEKITLSLSILFALLVYFLLLVKQLPPTSVVVPLISKYLLFIFIMNMLSVFNTCIVISCYYKQPTINLIHPWVRLLFIEVLPKVLFINRPVNKNRNKMFHDGQLKNKKNIINIESKGVGAGARRLSLSNRHSTYNQFYSKIIRDNDYPCYNESRNLQDLHVNSKPIHEMKQLKSQINEIPAILMNKYSDKRNYFNLIEAIKSIKYISYLTNHRRRVEIVRDDYRYMSAVLDRLMLITFFLVTSIGTLYFLFSTPHVFENVDQQSIIKRYSKQ